MGLSPKTEYQRCIVHQVRNTLKYVADKDRKPFANDLKTIYQAPSEEQALEALERVTEKWSVKYPNSMKSWKQNWDAISPIFKFSTEVRKVIYTTNAIESLNSTYRKLNRQRSVFPSDTALLKALYLANDAALVFRFGICRSNCFFDSTQPIGTDDQDIFYSAVFQFIQHGKPVL